MIKYESWDTFDFSNLSDQEIKAILAEQNIPLSIKDIKYDDSKNDPLFLVYASPSFYEEKPGPLTGVFVYEINKNYSPIKPVR